MPHLFAETDSRLEKLEAQVAELAQGAHETGRVSLWLSTLKKQMDQMCSSLESFLGRIQINNGLRLVPERRCLMSEDQGDIDLERHLMFLKHQDAMVEDLNDTGDDSWDSPVPCWTRRLPPLTIQRR